MSHLEPRAHLKVRGKVGTMRGIVQALAITALTAELFSAAGLKILGKPVLWQTARLPPRTEREPWGAWGRPGAVARLVGPCFDVEYRFNSVGARDRERPGRSSSRWIVLGDSMIEGYGIEEGERLTSLLEENLGWEFANFGGAGDLGPLQYLLLYRGLAGQFEHYGVVVGLLPFNDFTDNDREWWRLKGSPYDHYRYRPYAVLSDDHRSYRVIYGTNGDAAPRNDFNALPTLGSQEAARSPEAGPLRGLMRWLSGISPTVNLVRQAHARLTAADPPDRSGYFNMDERQIAIAALTLHDLSKEIGHRPKVILLLPMHPDLAKRRQRHRAYSEQVGAFLDGLRSEGWTVIDLAESLMEADRLTDITLGCDAHWNAETNRTVARFLLDRHRSLLTGVSQPPDR